MTHGQGTDTPPLVRSLAVLNRSRLVFGKFVLIAMAVGSATGARSQDAKESPKPSAKQSAKQTEQARRKEISVRDHQRYKLGSDSQRQEGVPQGKVTKFSWKSQVFAGTERDYWVYVPAQYEGS